MQFQGVRSTNLAAVGYDPDSQELVVMFTNGNRYLYPDVLPEHAEGLQSAESPGTYFANEIKGRYSGRPL